MNKISAKALLGTNELISSFDLVFLVYMQVALQEKGYEIDYKGIKCNFTFDDLMKTKYISVLMVANEKQYFKTLPDELDLFTSTFEEVLEQPYKAYNKQTDEGNTADTETHTTEEVVYKLPPFIFDPWTYKDYKFTYKSHEVDHDIFPAYFNEMRVYNLLHVDHNKTFLVNKDNFELAVLWSIVKQIAEYIDKGVLDKLHYYVIPLTVLQTNYPIPLLTYLVLENGFMQDFVNLAFEKDMLPEAQLGYLTWESVGLDLGLIKHYVDKEKLAYTNERYKPGDVVLLYRRKVADAKKSVSNKVIGCKIAVIRSITEAGIEFEHINTKNTRLTTEVLFSKLSEEVQALYQTDKDLGIRVTRQFIHWRDLGADFYLSNDAYFEEYFFTRLGKDGVSDQYVLVGDQPTETKLSYYDVIYTILEDYKVAFNKERFNEIYKA